MSLGPVRRGFVLDALAVLLVGWLLLTGAQADVPDVGLGQGGTAALVLAALGVFGRLFVVPIVGALLTAKREAAPRTNGLSEERYEELLKRLGGVDLRLSEIEQAIKGSLGIGGLAAALERLEDEIVQLRRTKHAVPNLLQLMTSLIDLVELNAGGPTPQTQRARTDLARITQELRTEAPR